MQPDNGLTTTDRPSSAMGRLCENVGHRAQKPPLPLAESAEKYRESLRKYELPTVGSELSLFSDSPRMFSGKRGTEAPDEAGVPEFLQA